MSATKIEKCPNCGSDAYSEEDHGLTTFIDCPECGYTWDDCSGEGYRALDELNEFRIEMGLEPLTSIS